ncbi:uncharacterized protein LOC129718302 [Wyeomyia smithii]|uniref:uncharacterized protein LOC129718302 n=1 Tax=Wyeomyia smithii TaxID=174621 RepID=UPI002468169F|nr:uncharacterized protein LOC129718302 [Wyeomyia smithii]
MQRNALSTNRKLISKMLKTIVLFLIFSFECQASPLQSNYRKYFRTRSPAAPGELHVEEVLEVFRTRSRPPLYGVYHPQVNSFLANDGFMRQKGAASTTPRPQLTTGNVPLERNPRTTYPTPSGDNVNMDYTFPFKPFVTITKYPSYARPTTTIIIQEATYEWTTEKPKTKQEEETGGTGVTDGDDDDDDYHYSDEDYDF